MALGNVQDTEATYLLDKNNNKFTAYMHEIAEPELIVQAGETKNIKIKYFNEYSSTRQITNLVIPRAELGQYNFVEFKFSI